MSSEEEGSTQIDQNFLEATSKKDHNHVRDLQDRTPVIIGNPDQTYGKTDRKEVELRYLEQDLIADLADMEGGKSSLESTIDSVQRRYAAHIELSRSVDGFEREQLTRHHIIHEERTPSRSGGVWQRIRGRQQPVEAH